MSSAETKLRKHIANLENDNATLRAEIQALRKKLGTSVWRIDGSAAEAFVHDLIGGTRTLGSTGHDLQTTEWNQTRNQIFKSQQSDAQLDDAAMGLGSCLRPK